MTKFDEFGLPIPKQIPPMPKTKSSETEMNERIRELIRLADVHILPDDSEYGHCIIGLEKFAELIVRECANQCLSDDCMRILNHMGVKYE